jgi:hypothetical protein
MPGVHTGRSFSDGDRLRERIGEVWPATRTKLELCIAEEQLTVTAAATIGSVPAPKRWRHAA